MGGPDGEVTVPGGGTGDVDPRIGSVVDKFTIVRLLGRGGMGAVYEARHAKLARRFAIKFLLPRLADQREILRRFENEAKAAGGLEHPNLAAVTDLGRAADGSPYLVMEFLEGQDCAKLLERLGPLPVRRAANIVVQACRGLAVAHRAAIIHRDLKPENLFVTDAGDGSDLVKVLDFGIAKLRSADGTAATVTGETFGTAHYMSPEQARGAGEVDERSDVWSLGVVLYELLAGCKPFPGTQFLHVIHQILSLPPAPLATLRPALPARLLAAIERALAKDANARWPTVIALADALAPFAGHASGTAGRRAASPTPAPRSAVDTAPSQRSVGPVEIGAALPLWRRARPRFALGASVVVLAVAAIVALAFFSGRRARDARGPASPPVPVSARVAFPPARTAPAPSQPPPPAAAPASPGDVRTLSGPSGHDQATLPAPTAPPAGPVRRVRKTGPAASRTTPAEPIRQADPGNAGGVKIDPANPY